MAKSTERADSILNVYEIFYSIQGESSYAGQPCLFIRLSGCNLRCSYCDTAYAFKDGRKMALEEILTVVRTFNCRLVEITGGEPLMQPAVRDLIKLLHEEGKQVLVETNGTQDLNILPSGTICIMDIKCPGSGESERTDWNNIDKLQETDEVKFVLGSRKDYDWACSVLRKHDLSGRVDVLFSPVPGSLIPADLAQWILNDQLNVRLQLQLHRLIWPDDNEGR